MYAIKLKLKLNNKEKTFFEGCAGYSKFIYNYALSLLLATWDDKSIKASDSKTLNTIRAVFTNVTKKQPGNEWMNQYSSRIYQHAFIALKSAFSRYRSPTLKGGLPRYKRKNHKPSFTVDNCRGKMPVLAGKKIKIPALGTFRLQQPMRYTCMSQTFTLSKEANGWYVSFLVADCCRRPEMAHTEKCIGVDLGIKTFATLNNGHTFDLPESIKKLENKIRLFQYYNRNKQTGDRRKGIKQSNNAKKYFAKLRKLYARLANIRKDFLHKVTTELATTAQEVKIEDLAVKNMMANHKLALAIGRGSFYTFRSMLEYKQSFYGFILTVVDRFYPSSKTCSNCGHIQDMPLKQRVFKCGNCGFKTDRDLNAAINIANWSPAVG